MIRVTPRGMTVTVTESPKPTKPVEPKPSIIEKIKRLLSPTWGR